MKAWEFNRQDAKTPRGEGYVKVGNDLSGPSANQGRKSNPIPISKMIGGIGGIGRIGHHGLEVTHEGARLFGQPLAKMAMPNHL